MGACLHTTRQAFAFIYPAANDVISSKMCTTAIYTKWLPSITKFACVVGCNERFHPLIPSSYYISMSEVTEVNDAATFNSLVSSLSPSTVVAISFHTPWAAPCAQMSLILKTLASSYPQRTPPVVCFLSLDAEALPDISESYDVTAVPFLVLQRAGKVLDKVSGSDASKVRDAVERHAGKGGKTGKLGLPPALEAQRQEDETPQTDGAKVDMGKYAPGRDDPATAPDMSSTQGATEELNQRLAGLVKAAPVMLFMKGTPSAPQCGFSRTLVGILREKGVRYGFFNIVGSITRVRSLR